MFQLPWSNFHELNLDWIMNKLKELDDKIIGSSTPSATPPEMDGVASPGVTDTFSRGDHRHPTDTSRASASALTQEISDRSGADILINNRIDVLDARVVPSDAYPLMDGAAESGSHVQYSRRDHRHPTDTSRAAQTDLQAEIDDRINDVRTLQGDINAVDAKINFSSAAPLMDSSSASSGSSTVMARADHVHPTDTSRASATDVATLQARMDAFAGSANPSDTMPTMDGVGTAGSGGNYSRGDHQHPSDTSKLDVAGGTVTGDLTVQGSLIPAKLQTSAALTNSGWYRVAKVPITQGTIVKFMICRDEGASLAETHEITLINGNSAWIFDNELSKSPASYLINKIRLMDSGYVDIKYDNSENNNVMVSIIPAAGTDAALAAIQAAAFTAVPETPTGETEVVKYYLRANAGDHFQDYPITYDTNSYFNATAVGRCYCEVSRNIAVIFINLQVSADIPANTTSVQIGRITLPDGWSFTRNARVITPEQATEQVLSITLTTAGQIVVANNEAVQIDTGSWYRTQLVAFLNN